MCYKFQEGNLSNLWDFGGREMVISTSTQSDNTKLLEWERHVIKEDYRREQEHATESPKWFHPSCYICQESSARMYQHAEGYLCDRCWIDEYMPPDGDSDSYSIGEGG